ncbi:MAG: ADP-forming succinate--CoA ligase subunit beta [Candidatus Xiphinematobacter sp.]|nr:MAG: ADP-forming succinate--CoA ligase subunit beta [Candidatus Xiphinematobacter sp.]
MNIHEYQAKQLFEKFQVAVPKGAPASTPNQARKVATELGVHRFVVKAQIHAGGRGKGVFANGLLSGVHLCNSIEQVVKAASQMLGNTLITCQTGSEGQIVHQVLIAESIEIKREYYFAIVVDREASIPLLVASQEGGVEIENIVEKSSGKILCEAVHPLMGLQAYQARNLAYRLGFQHSKIAEAATLFLRLFDFFVSLDCSLAEVNPLILAADGRVLALDAKCSFDDNALFRQPDVTALRDLSEEDCHEAEASRFDLNYVRLDGSVACLVNGAGLAMATMDIIKYYGGNPANFLDVGGSASEEQVTAAFKILLSDEGVKAILVNIFGGIMRCDVIAQGILNAVRIVSLPVPLIVRLEGTNEELGKKLLVESRLPIIAADDLADAAQKAVAAAKNPLCCCR